MVEWLSYDSSKKPEHLLLLCLHDFCLLYSKDVRLPVQLQRAMAAEAEAAREARAKVKQV